MIAYRVMRNKIGYGTSVAAEKLPSQAAADKEAKRLVKKAAKDKEDVSFFTQEYEESRT